jgi:protein-disulfide isomerase
VFFVILLLLVAAATGYSMLRPAHADQRLPSRDIASAATLSSGAVIGPEQGKTTGPHMTIVEWSDFQCPFCARMTTALQDARRRHPSAITIIYRYLPLPIHPAAYPAALAGTCADEQGRFEAMHDELFARQAELGKTPWQTLAASAGVSDTVKFDSCMSSKRHAASIEHDLDVADSLNINATPALIINGKLYIGAIPPKQLDDEISVGLRL